MIDTSGLARIGNMTAGGGLAGALSVDTATGYVADRFGWVGVTLAAPTRIASATITSAANGFDASGSTSTVTLRLYGKNGAAPANGSDGFKLGEITFTDVNAVGSRPINSVDPVTAWDHVWITIYTGVWAVAMAVEFEAGELPPLLPLPTLGKPTLYRKSYHDPIELPWSTADLPGTRLAPLQIDVASIAKIDFAADIVHAAVAGYEGPVGLGWHLYKRSGATLALMAAAAFSRVDHLVSTNQIASLAHHYATCSRTGAVALAPGFHQFQFAGSAHTTTNSANGNARLLVEDGVGRNSLRIEISDAVLHEI
jgi:hypothetical protein